MKYEYVYVMIILKHPFAEFEIRKGCCIMVKSHGNIPEIQPCTVERGSPVIRIIICDDDEVFLNKFRNTIESALQDMTVNAKIHTYSRAEDIGQPILESCDIAFLDIDFGHTRYNGLDIARKIRSIRKDAIIIFVTNFIDYAPKGYEIQAFRYMLKLDLESDLRNYLEAAITQLQSICEKLKIRVNGEIIDIPMKSILYIESQLRMVLLHVQKDSSGKVIKKYSCYASLSDMEKQLEPRGFLRIQKSYLVNMAHLQNLQCKGAYLDNGTILPVSEKNYAEVKQKYLYWRGCR